MITSFRKRSPLIALAALASLALIACDDQEDSPIQADQDVLETPDAVGTLGQEGSDTPSGDGSGVPSAGGLTGDQGNDSPAVNGDDNVAGDEAPDDDEDLTSDTGVQVTPTIVDATLGDDVTVVGILATFLSERVITLDGVTLEEQPSEQLLVIIPEDLSPDYDALDEGSLVAVAGEIVQVTDERLAEVDESIFDEHGEFLEGFRAAWGILASDVSAAEEGEE